MHLTYGKDAPTYKDLFSHPIVGWITGIHLDDPGKERPEMFNGRTGESFADKALACHVPLPAGQAADVEIVNIPDGLSSLAVNIRRHEPPAMRLRAVTFPVTNEPALAGAS